MQTKMWQKQPKLREDVSMAMRRFAPNGFTITDDSGARVGDGLYLYGSLFNHSCRPNCAVSFIGAGHARFPLASTSQRIRSPALLLTGDRTELSAAQTR
jgi:SET domain